MPDNPFLQPIRISLQPSRVILVALIVVHAGAAMAVFHTAMPAWVQWLLVCCAVASLGYWLQVQMYPHARQPRELLLDSDGRWRIADGNGRVLTATLCRDALIHPALIALHLRTEAGRFRVLLSRDNTDADTLRRLRVRLGVGSTADRGQGRGIRQGTGNE